MVSEVRVLVGHALPVVGPASRRYAGVEASRKGGVGASLAGFPDRWLLAIRAATPHGSTKSVAHTSGR